MYHNPHNMSQQDLCQVNNISKISKENIAQTFFDEKNDWKIPDNEDLSW